MSAVLDIEYLYALLPAWIRLRDQTEGRGTLKALLGVVASQAEILGDNLDQLYDDQFIETCAPWVIPYIGDLIGFRPLRPVGTGQPAATRAEVADTIGYRRRKGTRGIVEQLGFDVTGWPAMAVEYFARLSTTQYVRNHHRPQNAIVDVRSPMTAADIASAFDLQARTADVRRISSGRGVYNIPNLGVFVWRLRAYATRLRPAHRVGSNRYTFDPFGDDVPLVNPPQPAAFEFELTDRFAVPFPIIRYPLYAELEAWRAAVAASESFSPTYFAIPPFVVHEVDGTAIHPLHVQICDLSSWTAPTAPDIRVAVDPELGRFAFAAPIPPSTNTILVDSAYAFSGDYGSGPFARPVQADELLLEAQLPKTVVPSFAAADLATAKNRVIEIADSGIRTTDITLSPDDHLLVVRADDGQRPVLSANLTIAAVAGASVTLRGLGIASLKVTGRGPFTLRVEFCTLRGLLDWSATLFGTLDIDRSLCAAISVNREVDVTIRDSVLDSGSDSGTALSGGGAIPCGSLSMSRSTVFGTLAAREIALLENSIVTGLVSSERRQNGCLRYSYAPRSQAGQFSQTPRRFRCQPDLRIDHDIAAATQHNPALTAAERDAIASGVEAWLQPAFTSRARGQAGYAQLADTAPDEIRFGAEDDDEMGVFFGLFGPRRERNLHIRLSEYLRIGLEYGIVHAT
jgi:hypothetical protein